jgi:hypothetical protein
MPSQVAGYLECTVENCAFVGVFGAFEVLSLPEMGWSSKVLCQPEIRYHGDFAKRAIVGFVFSHVGF